MPLSVGIESPRGPRPGDRIPSEAEIVDAMGVARMTVRQALNELRTAGLLEAQPGRGVFVVSPPWYAELDQMNEFAHVLVESDLIVEPSELIYYYEKPWKWEPEHKIWRSRGKPLRPYPEGQPKTSDADATAWDQLLEAFNALHGRYRRTLTARSLAASQARTV
jgi:DNA-binding transcriptional MocR family regulator